MRVPTAHVRVLRLRYSTALLDRVERVRVENRVAVALLGQKALAVLGEVLIDGVARNERVKVRCES